MLMRRSLSCCLPTESEAPRCFASSTTRSRDDDDDDDRGATTKSRRRRDDDDASTGLAAPTGDEPPNKALSRSDLRQVELLGRSLSSTRLEGMEPIEGMVLVLARCRDRNKNCNLSWRKAFFALSHGGILRIFRSAEDRRKWADLGPAAENLAKWRSAMSDAHVVSCLRDLPEHEASLCRRLGRKHRTAYCGPSRARCAALGPTPIEADEQPHRPTSDEVAGSSGKDDDAASVETEPGDKPTVTATVRHSTYQTFEVWLRADIANPNAKPVLKFAGAQSSDVADLHHSLLTCSHHFHGPKPSPPFSHPLLHCYSPDRIDHRPIPLSIFAPS
mmetsp:Transcript_5512/g.14178  ORF Transcript_5512/g.14178 Transcript_5512/m.14178 type:complete len:331 (+) Transcript_5512:208-1200(+)